MLIELILALALGIMIGTATGLAPGIHINLVSAILLSISPTLLLITSPLTLIIFIIALAITHTIVDFIPSILLGAPNEDTALSILPGHQLLLEGKGYFAIIYSLYGALISIPILILLIPIFILIIPQIYPFVTRIIPLILVLLSFFMILTEQKHKKTKALIIFILSGFLGIASLNLNLKEPLLPLFSGLFGASSLILSIKNKTKIPLQQITPLNKIKISKKSLIKSISASVLASPFTAFLPGLGSSQAATIGCEVIGELDQKEFLILLGIINSLVMSLSFITFYSIQKSRTGAAVAMSKLIPVLSPLNLLWILTSIILTTLIVFVISTKLAKILSARINRINYSFISILVLVIITFLTIFLSGFLGLLILIVSTALGISAIEFGIKKSQLMGCLIIPTILLYLI